MIPMRLSLSNGRSVSGDFQTPGAVQVFLEYVDEGSRRIEIKLLEQ